MRSNEVFKKIILAASFVFFLFSIFLYSDIDTETTMTIYNTTGNSTDARGSLTIQINDTSNLDDLQRILSQKLENKNLSYTQH
jgi:hypothetical protein